MLERTLGRLAGTHARCAALCGFHEAAAVRYEQFAASRADEKTLAHAADRLDRRVEICMQHAIYADGGATFVDIDVPM